MSTPAQSRASKPVQPTRQQLDELIELMQRMLALPESPPDEASGSRSTKPPQIINRKAPHLSAQEEANRPGAAESPLQDSPAELQEEEPGSFLSVALRPVPVAPPLPTEPWAKP